DALTRVITVLVIACPHALGLAIPLVVSISTERAAKAGVLIKDRLALERSRTVSAVLFDKTGTLTTGEPVLTDLPTAEHTAGLVRSAAEMLAWASAAESDSERPLARAVVAAAVERGLQLPEVSVFQALTASGVTARTEAHELRVGGPHMV